ncbi:MAG: hypothetical protein JSU83_21620 [Deltaproteobacteria bacterium]|nr:MAG: hypothetical protein JSU83_21620 [Deltaproteobacteria bacterium]
MNTITLKTNGSIEHEGKIMESGPLRFLGFQIILDEGYTLRSYFELLQNYSLLAELNAFIPGYHEQYSACPQSGCVCNGVEYLEFSKTVEMIGSPQKRLEIYHSLKGISGDESVEIKSMQLANLLDLPIKLGKLRHIVFGDRVDLFEFDTVFTMFEFIDGIAWELSFHSTPNQCAIRR